MDDVTATGATLSFNGDGGLEPLSGGLSCRHPPLPNQVRYCDPERQCGKHRDGNQRDEKGEEAEVATSVEYRGVGDTPVAGCDPFPYSGDDKQRATRDGQLCEKPAAVAAAWCYTGTGHRNQPTHFQDRLMGVH